MIIAIVIGVSCLFWIIAAILFVCAKGVDRRISESKKDCVEKTTATVVDVEEVYKRNVDTYNYTWYPAYEFYVNGERVVQKSVIGTEKNSVQTGQYRQYGYQGLRNRTKSHRYRYECFRHGNQLFQLTVDS